MRRAHAALAVSEGKMALTRPCVSILFFFKLNVQLYLEFGRSISVIADSYISIRGYSSVPMHGAEKAFNFVLFLSHM